MAFLSVVSKSVCVTAFSLSAITDICDKRLFAAVWQVVKILTWD